MRISPSMQRRCVLWCCVCSIRYSATYGFAPAAVGIYLNVRDYNVDENAVQLKCVLHIHTAPRRPSLRSCLVNTGRVKKSFRIPAEIIIMCIVYLCQSSGRAANVCKKKIHIKSLSYMFTSWDCGKC